MTFHALATQPPMEIDTAIRSMPQPDERPRTAQSTRRDMYDGARHNYDTSFSYQSDQGPGPATMEITPPRVGLSSRSRPRYVPHASQRNVQEKEKPDCLTADQTIELFRQKIAEARNETHVFSGSEEVSDALKPKLTIDLGRARIARLPGPIIDLIIADVERLSLSHNMLGTMPSRIAECNHLRYLNIRSNEFKEIPPAVYSMPLLEILDVSKNRITTVPSEIKKLESLRVFSIVHNRLQDLPLELTELSRLKVLKVAENPFRRTIKNVIREKEQEVAFSEMLENEKDTALTTELLNYLKKLKPSSIATPILENNELNEPLSAVEPSRPGRRALSGRFPVVPAYMSSDPISEDGTSQQSKPSLPSKSHLRGLSGHSNSGATTKRPGIAPIVNGSERNRSNSESIIQATTTAARQKRIGNSRRDRTELDSIDETTAVRQQSHFRGFSHSAAVRRNGSISSPGAASSSPSSPRDARKERSIVRRLSSLPEHKTDHVRRPLVEGAKGILYALYQVRPHISGFIAASKGQDTRKSQLETSFHAASNHVDQLDRTLEYHAHDTGNEKNWEEIEEKINSDCTTCIRSFAVVAAQMQENTHKIVAGGDPRYVRSLMLMLYGSIVEIKNAIKSFDIEVKHHRRQMSSGTTHPIATIPEEPALETPVKHRPEPSNQEMDGMTLKQPVRLRSETVVKVPSQTGPALQPVQPVQPHPLQIPDSNHLTSSTIQGTYRRAPSALSNASARSFASRSRSNSRNTNLVMHNTSLVSTPGSADSYQLPPMATVNGQLNGDTGMTDDQEERVFEQIFLTLTKAYELALHGVPQTQQHLERCLNAANEQRQAKEVIDVWNALIQKCRTCFDLSQALQIRLTNMKLKDSGVGISSAEGGRRDPSFWALYKSFLSSFVGLVSEMKDVRTQRLMILPQAAVQVLRPVQKACQEVGHSIATSPWSHMLQGVQPMPAPTPFAPRGGGEHLNRPQFNRSATVANSNVSTYSQAIGQQQGGQSSHIQYAHYPATHRLQPQPSLSAMSTPTLAAPSSAGGASPQSATTSPMPATPLLAALGPAAQATVPSTPASLYGDSFFKGDVFQRADSLMSMPMAAGVNFLTNSRRDR